MTDRNTTPADHFDALRRLHNCNWRELAARLGITTQTLRRWRESDQITPAGRMAMAALLQSSLRACNADWLAEPIRPGRRD